VQEATGRSSSSNAPASTSPQAPLRSARPPPPRPRHRLRGSARPWAHPARPPKMAQVPHPARPPPRCRSATAQVPPLHRDPARSAPPAARPAAREPGGRGARTGARRREEGVEGSLVIGETSDEHARERRGEHGEQQPAGVGHLAGARRARRSDPAPARRRLRAARGGRDLAELLVVAVEDDAVRHARNKSCG